MAVEDKPEEIDRYLAENKDIREWKSMEEERARQLERDLKKVDVDGQIEMKRLELKAATMRLKSTTRVEVWRRTLIGLIKLPVLPIALLLIFILECTNKDIPENLDHFIDI